MRSLRITTILLLPIIFTACGTVTPPTNENASSSQPTLQGSSVSSEIDAIETHNVVFSGIVKVNPISVYMEGTHRLELTDGRFILLSSETVDLNGYVGEQAEVTGSVRPTVEQGGTIMRVEKIRLLSDATSSESSSTSVTSQSSVVSIMSSSAASSLHPQTVSSLSSMKPATPPSSVTPKVVSSAAASIQTTATTTAEMLALAKKMSKDNLAASNWTRSYCTEHIGFCVPIQKNWYFVSFGATTTALWHVEVGPAEINVIGDGPLSINLIQGDISLSGGSDGKVLASGDRAVGFRAWNGNRHFEISAPLSLRAAVEYITSHLTAMEK